MFIQSARERGWTGLVGYFVIVGFISHASGAATGAQFRVPSDQQNNKRGATKNVSVELHKVDGKLHRKITALQGVEFALKEPTAGDRPSRLTFKDSAGNLVNLLVPEFSPGDMGITIRIDPAVGFTELLGLKILDPVVISIAADGFVEADRPGVRAVAFQGKVSHSGCFLAAARSTDAQGRETFSIGGFTQAPTAPDGSMVRTPGETLDCEVQLTGRDGEEYVSRETQAQGRTRIAFVSSK